MEAKLYIFARDEHGNVVKVLESDDRALLETAVDCAYTPLVPQSPQERQAREAARSRALDLVRY